MYDQNGVDISSVNFTSDQDWQGTPWDDRNNGIGLGCFSSDLIRNSNQFMGFISERYLPCIFYVNHCKSGECRWITTVTWHKCYKLVIYIYISIVYDIFLEKKHIPYVSDS